MNLLTKVKIIPGYHCDDAQTGTIVGVGSILVNQATLELAHKTREVFLVMLDKGFYDTSGQTYISTVIVDSSALEVIKS